MSMEELLPQVRNQENDPRYNREPGIALVPGSPYNHEMAKFEQHHGPITAGTTGPGNPYVYRPYPKMLYRAEHYQGKACCMAAEPDSYLFKDDREYGRALIEAQRFTERCQRIVKSEEERSRAMESGWRESPEEAVDYLLGRDRARSTATAERNYEDRNMSPQAKAEADLVIAESGGEHQPEITGRKVAEAKDGRRRRKSA